jgi:tetratricopeptide (TPR) repeat protein
LLAAPRPVAAEEDRDADFQSAISLAQNGRMDEARAAFVAGHRRWPGDPRFSIELGGVAFKQKRYADAAKWLRRGLQLSPDDRYATDFLATVYFLQGNLEAALRYWNRIGKPEIQSVRIQPELRVDPVLLDSAFTFAPGGTLLLSDLLTTRERIGGLGIFPAFTLRLDAREDGTFVADVAARERDGFGGSLLEALAANMRGVAYQTVYPEYFNIGRSALNVESMIRWDSEKRRLESSVSGPLRHDARRRYRLTLDLRNENWDLRRSFQGPAPSLGGLNLLRIAAGGELVSFRSHGWSWSAGGELSYRDYRNVAIGPGLPREVLLNGYALKARTQVNRDLWRRPDRRFESSLQASSETATIWSAPPHTFERLQVALAGSWLPAMTGDDYRIGQTIRAGRIIGQAPFDELFMLGLERDNDLWLRAHPGTRDGVKGSAPLGRDYFLSNWEIDKNIYRNALFSIKLSPFLDTGRSTDSIASLGSGKWLWDTGVQAKIRVLGVGLALIYGKDLRAGHNAFYLTAQR